VSKWEFSALPQGDELRKDGRLVASYCEAEAILNGYDRLVDALRWYQEKAKYCRKITDEGEEARQALDMDGGEMAKTILGELEKEQGK